MAQNTKIIKLYNNGITYVPVTLASAVQYTYTHNNQPAAQSVQTILDSEIATVLAQNEWINTHGNATTNLSYDTTNGIMLSGIHGQGNIKLAGGTGVTISYANNVLTFTAGQSHDLHSDDQTLSGSGTASGSATTSSVAKINLSEGGYVGIKGSAGANGVASVKVSYNSPDIQISVSYTDTKPNNATLSVTGNTGTAQAFSADESTNKTLSIVGSTNNPIQTKSTAGTNMVTVTVDHAKEGTNIGTFGETNTTVSAGQSNTITIPKVTVNTYGHVTAAENQSVTIDLSSLTGAMHYVGKKTSLPTSLPGTYHLGDVISYNSAEYVLEYENSSYAWRELGDESSHALKTVSITGTDGLTGGGTIAEDRTISHAVPSGASAGKKDSANNNFIKSVTTDKFGHITAYTTGTFTQSNDFGTVTSGSNSSSYTAITPNTNSATSDSQGDTLTISGGNYWIKTGASDTNDTFTIGHALAQTATQSTQGLYKMKIDAAGHVYETAAVSTDNNLLASLTNNYQIIEGNTVDDLNSSFLSSLGLSGTSGNDIVTGTQTSTNYYHS